MPAKPQPTQLKILSCDSNEQGVWANIAIEGSQLTVTPQVAKLLLEQYPSLAQHACKSGGSSGSAKGAPATFGNCLCGALLPHAAEHLAIDLMVRAHPGEVFAGNTCWISREKQCMRVRLSLAKAGSSSEALKTLKGAIELLNDLLLPSNQRQMG